MEICRIISLSQIILLNSETLAIDYYTTIFVDLNVSIPAARVPTTFLVVPNLTRVSI